MAIPIVSQFNKENNQSKKAPNKGDAVIFFFVLAIVIFVIFYIGIKLNKKNAQPEGIVTEPLLQKQVVSIKNVTLNVDFLGTDKFKELQLPAELPVKAENLGKNNLF